MSRHFATTGRGFEGIRLAADPCRACTLGGAALCRAMSEASAPGRFTPTCRRFDKGQEIFEPGALHGLGVIRRGYVRRSTLRLDGKRILMGLAVPGDILSTLPCRESECDLEAATDVEICLYDHGAVQRILQKDLKAMSQLLHSVDDQHHRLLGALWRYGGLASRERIIAFLVAATDFMPTEPLTDGSIVLTMEIDRRDWADLTNTAVETISRTLRYLEEKCLVTSISPYRFHIANLDGLALIAGVEPPERKGRQVAGPARGADLFTSRESGTRMTAVNAGMGRADRVGHVHDRPTAPKRGGAGRRPEDVKEEIRS